MGTVVLDSSVVIAIFDSEDAHHGGAMQALREKRAAGAEFCIPASVLSEVLVGEVRRGDDSVRAFLGAVRGLFGQSRVMDDDVAVAELRARHRPLRLPDALVIATGIVDDATTILTGDKRWAGVDHRVEVLSEGHR